MFYSNCGEAVLEDVNFCPNCGRILLSDGQTLTIEELLNQGAKKE